MKTLFSNSEASRNWVLVDADTKVVGRLASDIAQILRGNNKPNFAAHQDCGDFVVVVNAEKMRFTGQKLAQKTYYRHSGFVGGIKKETAGELMKRAPEEVLYKAVKGMLPKTTLGRAQLKKLKVYAGTEHPHDAQKPVTISL
ncbi:UNVERIFIED_CONTAM: hypothetical protein GTU68_060313 [Idotea baltica]|nr:hypothetical protein [Idotea baltica]